MMEKQKDSAGVKMEGTRKGRRSCNLEERRCKNIQITMKKGVRRRARTRVAYRG